MPSASNAPPGRWDARSTPRALRQGVRLRAARKTPFVAAAQVSADGRPERLRLSPVAGLRKRALPAWAAQHLQPGTLVRSDGLACFRGVQAAGCAHQAQVTGGGKGSCETPGLSWVNTLLGNVKRAIDGTYHACEARYAGRYLAEFAYYLIGATSWPTWCPVWFTLLCAPRPCPIGS